MSVKTQREKILIHPSLGLDRKSLENIVGWGGLEWV